ncbi:MAG: response regulator transcription factor [Acidimicrobiales bacterium]|jgi:DNA-binding NarL/FixJ family response regulator
MSAPDGETRPIDPITVCLVEDHAQVRDELSVILTGAGMSVLAAVGTAHDGRRAVTELLPDVAVVDNRLPDGTGIELCRTLTETVPGVTLILHTGTVDRQVAIDARDAGAVAVVPKEIRTDHLIDTIRRNHPGARA